MILITRHSHHLDLDWFLRKRPSALGAFPEYVGDFLSRWQTVGVVLPRTIPAIKNIAALRTSKNNRQQKSPGNSDFVVF